MWPNGAPCAAVSPAERRPIPFAAIIVKRAAAQTRAKTVDELLRA
ncbi:hypothetical protein ACMHYB_60785 [Sorangium sp. So ce1128]